VSSFTSNTHSQERLNLNLKVFRIFGPIAILALSFTNFTVAKISAAEDSPRHIAITAKRFAFSPAEIEVKKDVPVTLTLTDEDFPHGIKFADLNITLQGTKGETKEVTFTPTQAGDFVAQCTTFCGAGHGDMVLTMHVTE
jgi:cytochrome c oxidase subunit 2